MTAATWSAHLSSLAEAAFYAAANVPGVPRRGQTVRFRLFDVKGGVPVEDTESIYAQNAAAGQLSEPVGFSSCRRRLMP